MVFTSDTRTNFRFSGDEAGGETFPDLVFNATGSAQQTANFVGQVNGKAKGDITNGFIRETFNRVNRADGNDLYTIQAEVTIQWQSPEGYIYDMNVMGNILSDSEAVIPLLTSTFVLPNENFYCWFGGTLRTNDPDLARFNGRTVIWGVAEERILLPEGIFQSTAVLYGIQSPEDTWDSKLIDDDSNS